MLSFNTDETPGLDFDDNETALMDEISFSRNEKKPARAKPVRSVPRMVPRPSAPSPEDPGLDDFINPEKRFASSAPPPPHQEEYEEEDGEQYEEQPGQQYPGGGGEVPADGYKTIEDEKADLLNKISRLIKKGIQGNGRLNSYTPIEEVRTEYKRMTYSIEVDRSIKFQKRMLIATVTGLEFLNKKFDPFDLQLDGWSENMMEQTDDYDGVFEDLHNKYKNKIEVAPEIKLIMMVGGSAMMFHLTNSMFKQAVNVSQVMNQNPQLQRDMMDAVQRAQTGVPISSGGPPRPGLRGEMRGPGVDFGSLMGMMQPPQSAPPPQVDELSDVVSDAGGDTEVREVSVKAKKGRKSSKKEISI
jgi:Family of unknown function (DUF5767)